jgi:hypothetical protein
MSFRFLLAADLGQSPYPSALAILEEKLLVLEKGNINRLNEQLAARAQIKVASKLECRWLERIPLGTPYPKVLDRCQAWLKTPELVEESVFLLDYTGVGHPVYDFAQERGMAPIGINIHGGRELVETPAGYNVPKRDLVSILLAMFQSGRLEISDKLPFAQILRDELINFRMKISPQGKTSYEAWREGEHDDLVLALAIACWYAHHTGGGEQRMIRLTRPKDWDPLGFGGEEEEPRFNPLQYGRR